MCSWRSSSLFRVRKSAFSILLGTTAIALSSNAWARQSSRSGSQPRPRVPAQPRSPEGSTPTPANPTPSNDLVTAALRNCSAGSTLTVASYNVENFWDDIAENSGSATYDEYRKGGSNWYTDQMYKVKAKQVADAIRMAGSPDIVAMEEIESGNNTSRSLELLKPQVEAMGYKFFALGEQNPNNPVAVTTAVISKFPIVKNERLDFTTTEADFTDVGLNGETISGLNTSARDPQVVTIDVEGSPLRVYASHWKSRRGGPGAGDAMRLAVAKLIKRDIEKQKTQNPALDILVTGDFNASYDETPLVEGLHSTEDKNMLKSESSDPRLYNFWFELPAAERCSYMHDGQLHCLDHMLSTASLFDGRGIDFVEGSFQVIGHNGGEAADKLLQKDGRTPRRWSMSKGGNGARFNGNGYSDHLPLVATFKIANRCSAGR